MAEKYTKPRGTYDILPTESYKIDYIRKIFRKTAKVFQYKEIVTPIFEKAGLFERSVGDTSDIIQKEMYKFPDKKNRIFALRPEGTAPVVRAYIENNLGSLSENSKLFYIGPMFRYDRPQKGRYRQFFQYGIENIGSDSAFTDAEVIALGYNFLKGLGLKNFVLEINNIGCSNCSTDLDEALKDYFKPHLDELCRDCKIRLYKNPKRILDCKVKVCKKIAEDAPVILDYLDEECKTHFDEVKKYLDIFEVPYIVNPKIVRGLDYYSKTAFEFIDSNLGAQNALIGGGRYDGLVKQLGGKDVPGIGLAGGFERLLSSMEAENIVFDRNDNPKIFLIALGEKAKTESVKILNKLRVARISTDCALAKDSMKAQMKAANKVNSKYTLILGEDELKNGEIILKEMETGNQEVLKIQELIEKASSL